MNTNSFCPNCGQNMQAKVLRPHCLGDSKTECPYNLPKMTFIHEIKLNEDNSVDNEFTDRFNTVSDLFSIATREDTKEAWNKYHEAKIALEQGYSF